MADKDFLDYDLMARAGFPPTVANALLTMWERTGGAKDVDQTLDELSAASTEASWGSIKGDLSEQKDLKEALDKKADAGETNLTYDDYGQQSGSLDVDYEKADVQAVTLTGNLTLNVTNWPSSGTPAFLRLVLNDADAHTLTLPSWTWAEGAEPTFSSHDRIALYSEDGGVTVYAVRYFTLSAETVAWGNITGTLANQTDLLGALDQAGPVLVGGDSSASNLDTVTAGDSTTSNTDTYHAGAA